jgi:hypothetical protein
MKHKRVNKFTYLIAFIVLAGILLANGCAIETENQLQIATDEPTATETQVIPTETEMPTYVVQDSLEVFTPAQEALNQSPEALAQQERFQRWLDYWVQFDNRPFAPGSVDIHWKPVYDNPQNPTEVIMLLEVGGPDYKNATFLPPHNADGPIDYPPEVSGSEIALGLGPMEIDLNKDGTVTRAYQGTLARFDSQGNLVETLVGNHWEAVEQYPIDIEKLHNFPESYEYMVANLDEFVEFPDPFVDPDGFNASVEKLKTIIGDYTQREKNYTASSGNDPGFYVADAWNYPNSLEGQPEIAYFQHQGVVYPMIGLNVYDTDSVGMGSTRTFLVILYDGLGAPEGTGVIKTLADGGHIAGISLMKKESPYFPDAVNNAIRKGLVPIDDGTYDQIIWGFGRIQTQEGLQKLRDGN